MPVSDEFLSAFGENLPKTDAATGGDDEVGMIAQALGATEASGENAVSPKGASGKMQVMPATFKDYAKPGESFDRDEDRTRVAMRKIADDYQWAGTLTKNPIERAQLVAAAYQGGRGGAVAWANGEGHKRSDGNLNINQYVDRFMSRLGAAADIAGAIRPQRTVDSNAGYAIPTSGAEDLFYKEEAQRNQSPLVAGFKQVLPQTKQAAGALLGMAGDQFGSGGMHDLGYSLYDSGTKELENINHPAADLKNVTDGKVGFGDYVKYWLGYGLGNVLESATVATTAGLIGAGTGSVVPGAGNAVGGAAGFMAGLIGKSGAKKMILEAGQQAFEKTLAKGAGIEAAKVASEQAVSQATKSYGTKVLAGLAAASGQGVNNFGLEAGEIYGHYMEQATQDGRVPTQEERDTAFWHTLAAAGTETLSDLAGIGTFLKTGKRIGSGIAGAAATIGKEAAIGMAREVPTEVIQTYLERKGQGKPVDDEEAMWDYANAAGGAAVMGGAFGGGAGIKAHFEKPQATAPVPKPNSPLSNAAQAAAPAPQAMQPAGDDLSQAETSQSDQGSPFNNPDLDAKWQDLSSFIGNRQNIQALRRQSPDLPGQAFQVWNNVINNPSIPMKSRVQALEQAHSMIRNIPNFTMGNGQVDSQSGESNFPVSAQPAGAVANVRQPSQMGSDIDGEATRISGMLPGEKPESKLLTVEDERQRQAQAEYDAAYQDMVKAEQLGAGDAELMQKQIALREAEGLMRDIHAAIDGNRALETAKKRDAVLTEVLANLPAGQNPMRAFGRALKDAGFTDTDFSDVERQKIARWKDIHQAVTAGQAVEIEPSLPNEMDANLVPEKGAKVAQALKAKTVPARVETQPVANDQSISTENRFKAVTAKVESGWQPGQGLTIENPSTGETQVVTPAEKAVAKRVSRQKVSRTQAPEPVAEAIAPAASDPVTTDGGTKVQTPAVDDQDHPLAALGLDSANRTAAGLTRQGFPSKVIPHPSSVGRYAVVAQESKAAPPRSVTSDPVESTNPVKAMSERDQAMAELGEGIDELVGLLGGKHNLLPDEEAKLIPIMSKVFRAAARLGYLTFKDAARFVVNQIRSKSPEVADRLSIDNLQAGYINIAREIGGDKKEALSFDSIDELMEEPDAKRDQIAAAEERTDTKPTEAQKEAGNYAKGKFTWNGQTISVENPKGSIRSGIGEDGKPWTVEMPATYGYFLGTVGADKDHVDVFMGPNPDAPFVWVMNQTKADGSKFDEHKVLAGFDSPLEAAKAYRDSFSDGFGRKVEGALSSPIPVSRLAEVLPELSKHTAFDGLDGIYPLGEGELIYNKWAGAYNLPGKVTPAMRELVNRVRKAKDDGVFYTKDLVHRITQEYSGHLPSDYAERNSNHVEDGDWGMEIYYANKAAEDEKEAERRTEVAKELALKPGMKLGTLIFNDGKVTRSVEVQDAGNSTTGIVLTGSRGNSKVQITTDVVAIKHAIERADEKFPGRKEKPEALPAAEAIAQPAAEHIENGEAEPATSSVIADSVEESAKNTDMDINQAREWLLNAIDTAVLGAPYKTDSEWSQAIEVNADYDRKTFFVEFDVPGDGKFSVKNSQERLNEFKKKVMASPGFKKYKHTPPAISNGVEQSKTTVRNMLDDGDLLLAADYGHLVGEPLLFGAPSSGHTINVYTNAEDAELSGFDAMVGRSWAKGEKSSIWHVIELGTGLSISSGKTKAAALAKAQDHLEKHGDSKLKDAIAQATKQSQDELEKKWTDWAEEQEKSNSNVSLETSSEATALENEQAASTNDQPESTPDNDQNIDSSTEDQSFHTLKSFDAFISKLYDGDTTIEQYQAAFAGLLSNEQGIRDELSKLKKDQLLSRMDAMKAHRYKNDRKDEVVSAAFDSILSPFTLGRSISYVLGPDMRNGYRNAVKKMVESTTAEDLKKFADEVAAAREERTQQIAQMKEAIKDPQTLDDFITYIRAKKVQEGMSFTEARMTLSPEQRARYDELTAEKSRDDRRARADQQKTEVRVAGQTTSGQVIETKHTRTGEDLFVVKAADRVEREIYNQWNATAKRLGGWYSSYRGNGAVPGFQFKTKADAEAFLQYLGGDTEQVQDAVQAKRDAFDDDRSQTAAERLNEMADRLEGRADEELGRERKANTERRARMAANAESAANADKAMAKTMRNIAGAIENGTAKFLDRIRQKKQVEMLAGMVRTAKDNELRSRYQTYAEQEKRKGEPPTAETADFADFPSYSAYRSDLATLGRRLLEAEGTKKFGQAILKVADDVTDAYLKFAKENLHKVSTFSLGDGKRAVIPSKEAAESAIARSGFKGKAIVLPFKRGENIIIMSPSAAREAGIWQGDDDKRITLTGDFGDELVEKVGKANRRGNKVYMPWQFESAYDRRKALSKMGIETPAEFRSMLREFINLREQAKELDRVKMLERAMVGRKNDGLDFFPTPQEVADQMVDVADIQPDMAVLEPSAGMGHIADRIREAGAEPDVLEFASDRRELLQEKGFHVMPENDFLSLEPRKFYTYGDVFRAPDGTEGIMRGSGGMGSDRVRLDDEDGKTLGYYDREELNGIGYRGVDSGYDRIIMNPPFSGRRDAEHVMHAYSLLKPGGRLVALMGEGVFFGQDKKAKDFRNWLEAVGGSDEKLPEGSFMDPSLPVNTAVNARMVVIDKPENDSARTIPPVVNSPESVYGSKDVRNTSLPDSTVQDREGRPVRVTLDQSPEARGVFAVQTVLTTTREVKLGRAGEIYSPQDAATALGFLTDFAVEHFDALVTDGDGNPLAVIGSFKGRSDQTTVHADTMLREAIRVPGAAEVWFAHNHPSGNAALSDADTVMAKQLHDLFSATKIKPMGFLAIARQGNKARRWAFTPDGSDAIESGIALEPTGAAKVPVMELTIGNSLPMVDVASGYEQASRWVPTIANGNPTVVLLNTEGEAVAAYPMTPEIAGKLRTDSRVDELLRAVSVSNASRAVIANPDWRLNMEQMRNLSTALEKMGVRVEDWLNYQDNRRDHVTHTRQMQNEPMTRADGQFYSMGGRATDETPTSIRAALVGLFGETGIANLERGRVLRIVGDMAEVPEHLRNTQSEAVYDPETGTAWLVANRITEDRAPKVLLHEIGEHFGLKEMVGERGWSALAGQVKLMAKKNGSVAQSAWNGVKEHYSEFSGMDDSALGKNDRFLHEVIAKLGENAEIRSKSFWKDLVAMVKRFLVKLGFAGHLDEKDVAELVSGSLFRVIGEQSKYVRYENPKELSPSELESAKSFDRWFHGENGRNTSGAMSSVQPNNTRLAAEVLTELAADDGLFTFKKSEATSLKDVFRDIYPDAEFYGEHTRADEQDESGADHRFVFTTHDTGDGEAKTFYVFTKDSGRKVWVDVSRLETGDGGQQIYAAVLNWAHNNRYVLVGDPNGVSKEATIRRTSAMMSSALRFGTTRHMEPSDTQLKGDAAAGIEPLKWGGNDFDNLRSLIHTFVTTLHNQFPALNGYHYDFSTAQFRDRSGRPIGSDRFSDAARLGLARASAAGGKTLRRGIFLKSLLEAAPGQESGIFDQLYRRPGQITDSVKPLFSIPFEPPAAARFAEEQRDPSKWFNSLLTRAGDALKGSDKFGWMDKSIHTQLHKAEKNPYYGAVFKRLQHFMSDASRAALRPAELAPTVLPRIDVVESIAGAVKSFVHGKEAAADVDSAFQAVLRGTLDNQVYRSAEEANLTDGQFSIYREYRDSIDASLDELSASEAWQVARGLFTVGSVLSDEGQALKKETLDNPTEARSTIAGSVEDMVQSAKLATDGLVDRAREAAPFIGAGDAETALKNAKALGIGNAQQNAAIAKALEAFGTLHSLEDVLGRVNSIFDRRDKLQDDGYAPLMRFGQHYLHVKRIDPMTGEQVTNDEGEPESEFFGLFESEAERDKARKEFEEENADNPNVVIDHGTMSEEGWRRLKGVSPESIALFADKLGIDQDEVFQQWYRHAVNNRSALKRLVHRKGIAGFSTDGARVLASFLTSNGRRSSMLYHTGDINEAIEAFPKQQGAEKDEAIKLAEYVQNPQEEAAGPRSLMFMHFLGGSVSNFFINATQPVMVTLPYLAKTVGMRRAMALLKEAYGQVRHPDQIPDEVQKAIAQAEQEGVVGAQEIFHLWQETARPVISKLSKYGEGITYRANAFMQLWGMPFALAEHINRRVSFISAYNAAKESGMTKEQAYSAGISAVNETQFVYGRHNRPNAARGSIGSLVFTFKLFSISYVELLTRMLRGNPESKKAALWMLGILVMAAGVQGLPGADDMDDLFDTVAQMLGYNVSSKKAKRKWLESLAGKEVAQVVLYGLSSLTPLDVSSRMGLGNLIPATGVLKPSNDKKFADILELVGPVGGLAQAYVNTADAVSTGDWSRASTEWMPKALKDFSKGAEMAITGEARDGKGRKVMDVDYGAALVKMIGFNPQDIAQTNRVMRDNQQQIDFAKRTESVIADKWAKGIVEGDQDAVRSARESLAEWNASNPDTPIGIKVSQVQRRVKEIQATKHDRFLKSATKEMRESVAEDID